MSDDESLNDLRTDYQAQPYDSELRESLARALLRAAWELRESPAVEQRAAILAESRQLHTDSPFDGIPRSCLARGLFCELSALKMAKLPLDVHLFDQLQALQQDYPDDEECLRCYCAALSIVHEYARDAHDANRQEVLLNELRALTEDKPASPYPREWLSGTLCEWLCYDRASTSSYRDRVLDELRALAQEHPDEQSLQESLSKALFCALLRARNNALSEYRDQLLRELREIEECFPNIPDVREWLSKALYTVLYCDLQSGRRDRQGIFLDELRKLQQAYSHESEPRLNLARSIFLVARDADAPYFEALVRELRTVNAEFPEDSRLRTQFADLLLLAERRAGDGGDAPRVSENLDELRRIFTESGEDVATGERLAEGFFGAAYYAAIRGENENSDQMVDELRSLHKRFPGNSAIAGWYVKAISNACDEGDCPEAYLEEFQSVTAALPDDGTIAGCLAGALYNVFWKLVDGDEVELTDSFLDEVRALAQRFPSDAEVRRNYAWNLFTAQAQADGQGDVDRRSVLLAELLALRDSSRGDPLWDELEL